MKPENLESLLIDHALGQLSPEVADLLDNHLRQNPSAAQRAGAFAATLDLARQAVTLPPPAQAAIAPLPWVLVKRAAWRRTWSREALKLAACIAVGFVSGGLLRGTSPVHGPLVATVHPLPPVVRGAEKNVAAQFWSSMAQANEVSPRAGTSEPLFLERWLRREEAR